MVSFIFPIYGITSDVLLQGLNRAASIQMQSTEFILVSDGASDEVVDVCKKFIIEHKKFKLIEQKNQGVSAARNTGISAAQGRWVSFVDPDDLLDIHFGSSVLPYLEQDTDIIFGGFKRFYGKCKIDETFSTSKMFHSANFTASNLIGATLSDSSYYQGIYGYFLGTPWGKLFRRNFLLENGLKYPVGIVKREDSLFAVQCFKCNPKISVIPENLYLYRIDHQNSISNNYNSHVYDSFLSVFKIMSADLSKWLENSDNKQIYNDYALRLAIELLFSDFCNPHNEKKYGMRKKEFNNYLNNPILKYLIKNAELKNMPVKQKILGQLIKWHSFGMLNFILSRRGK